MTSEEPHGQSLSAELFENFRFPEHGDLTHEEFVQEQECVFRSLQITGCNRGGTPDPGQSNDLSPFLGQEGESSRSGSLGSQLARDEALARFLEEYGDDFDDSHLYESFGHSAGSSRASPDSPSETPVTMQAGSPDVRDDEVNPDDMSYEQLLSLEDSMGTEGRGLSEDFISAVPYFEYKPRDFSNEEANEECVICQQNYNQGEYMIALPCSHQYHRDCISKWLTDNKTCPVCKVEVREE